MKKLWVSFGLYFLLYTQVKPEWNKQKYKIKIHLALSHASHAPKELLFLGDERPSEPIHILLPSKTITAIQFNWLKHIWSVKLLPSSSHKVVNGVFVAGKNLQHIPKIIANTGDEDSISDMCKSTKVVLNCVGPVNIFNIIYILRKKHQQKTNNVTCEFNARFL